MFCRCRYDDSDMCALKFDDDERVTCTTVQGRKKVFEFEKVYSPETSQETVSSVEIDKRTTVTLVRMRAERLLSNLH